MLSKWGYSHLAGLIESFLSKFHSSQSRVYHGDIQGFLWMRTSRGGIFGVQIAMANRVFESDGGYGHTVS